MLLAGIVRGFAGFGFSGAAADIYREMGLTAEAVAGRIAERGATAELDGHALFTPLQLGTTLP